MNALPPGPIGEPALRTLRRELAPALVENQRKGETAATPGVLFEEASFFLDPARFAIEQRRLFREMPLVACLSAELADTVRVLETRHRWQPFTGEGRQNSTKTE